MSGGSSPSGREASLRPSTRAPIKRKGLATRPIGRRDREGSPVNVVSNGRPAKRPQKSRMVVPELPQSSAVCASRRPENPSPSTSAVEPDTCIGTPRARKAAAVSVEKNGFPVPAAKITRRPFSRCRMARRRIYGSATARISMADITRVKTPIRSRASIKTMEFITVPSMPI